MKYLIFGAGFTGKIALHFLGYWRVEGFISNSPSDDVEDKPVISYQKKLAEMRTDKYIVVVASDKYCFEMVEQLKSDKIKNFFVFREKDVYEITEAYPHYRLYMRDEWKTYTEILAVNHVDKYKKIAVLGNNYYLPYLLAEISFIAKKDKIAGVIRTSAGQIEIMNIPEVTMKDVENEIDCLIINEKREKSKLVEKLLDNLDRKFDLINIFGIENQIPEFYHPELERYKDIHKDKRCFIIGNGPSLMVEDLNKLHENNEICFAFNRIFKIYNQTKWRPDYYGISDPDVIPGSINVLSDMKGKIFMSDEFHRTYDNRKDNVEFFHWIIEEYYPNHPCFSSDITRGTYFGYSTVYDIGLQFAAYMGFSEIYLLGVDHSFTANLMDDNNHFTKDYFTEEEKIRYRAKHATVPRTGEITKAYEAAKNYSKKYGFHIYNATRGGKLEVFDRVDFDGLFEMGTR